MTLDPSDYKSLSKGWTIIFGGGDRARKTQDSKKYLLDFPHASLARFPAVFLSLEEVCFINSQSPPPSKKKKKK